MEHKSLKFPAIVIAFFSFLFPSSFFFSSQNVDVLAHCVCCCHRCLFIVCKWKSNFIISMNRTAHVYILYIRSNVKECMLSQYYILSELHANRASKKLKKKSGSKFVYLFSVRGLFSIAIFPCICNY